MLIVSVVVSIAIRGLRATCPNSRELLYSDGGSFAHPPAVAGAVAGVLAGGRGRGLGRCGRGCVDVLAVYVLGIAEEGRALVAAGVALLEAVELKSYTQLERQGAGNDWEQSHSVVLMRRQRTGLELLY